MNYKATLNLPKTEFSMQAKLRELEPRILNLWEKCGIYSLVRKNSKGRPKFILHDGPPYANGDIHIGHALNKILKDFVVKYKIMQGFDVPFVPGWDCHGLPVEHQLFKELGIGKEQIDKVEFRKKARGFALKFVDIQREQFKQLGLIADWQRPYLTLDFAYEAEIVRAFAKLVKGKYIYRGLKPINWCMNCETALAEAEVEYEQRNSPSIFVRFKLAQEQQVKLGVIEESLTSAQLDNAYFVIWTTTPWTLVANVACALHPQFQYSFVKVCREAGPAEILILADDLVNSVMAQVGIKDYQRIAQLEGARLEGLKLLHPFISRTVPIVLADYVSNQEGTGCVHTACGHGQEDYFTGLKYKLPVIMPVDEKGRFNQSVPEFSGTNVFSANALIIDKMAKNKSLLYATELSHAYPHCWRCKSPLITRSTKQWFINVEHNKLRQKALRRLRDVQWIPANGEGRISSMIQTRPDWCLSRQRFWGVPIPVFYCRHCGKEILRPALIERFARKVLHLGSDVWFTETVDELLGETLRCPACRKGDFIKEEDIIDVWFDSGISHQAVLLKHRQLAFPATLYLEGSDQHRGWFQSALLTSIPLTGRAPYKKVLTHGFVVDGEGKKMSKSRGNVISPQEIIDKYGAEILRLWVASCDYTDDVRISPQILENIADAYRKIRNTLRFLLGNLDDFSADKKIKYGQLPEIDRWALSSLTGLLIEVTEDYERYLYYRVFRKLYNFCVQQMSSFYLDVLKDRLYTHGKNSFSRRSAQTAICEILTALTRLISPILTFTAQEVWEYLSKILRDSSGDQMNILQSWPKIKRSWINPGLDEKMARLSEIRDTVLKAIENEREKGLIRSSLEARVRLYSKEDKLHQLLSKNQELLTMIFIVSDVTVVQVADFSPVVLNNPVLANLGVKVERIDFPKCQRCWNYRSSVGKDSLHPLLCSRCIEALAEDNKMRLGEGCI